MSYASWWYSVLEQAAKRADPISIWGTRLIGLLLVWTLAYILTRHLSRWLSTLSERSARVEINAQDLSLLDRLLGYVIVLVAFILSMAILGWTSLLYSALTAAGLFSIVLGLALQDMVANLTSGIFILFDRPFVPGDFIQVEGYTGTVQRITLRNTIIATPEGPFVHLPNRLVIGRPTVNYTVPQVRPINFVLSVPRDADINLAFKTIKRTLDEQEGLLKERTRLTLLDDAQEAIVHVSAKCYAASDVWPALASHLPGQVTQALASVGILPHGSQEKLLSQGEQDEQDI
jgi:small-conductance mechanosensitive channel